MTGPNPSTPCPLITNWVRFLLAVRRAPTLQYSEISKEIGCEQRQVQRIIQGLCEWGYLTTTRTGRGSLYTIHEDAPLGAGLEGTVGRLLELLDPQAPGTPTEIGH